MCDEAKQASYSNNKLTFFYSTSVNNNIEDEGGRAFEEALMDNKTLTKLNLVVN